MAALREAPEWRVDTWLNPEGLNAAGPLSLAAMRGRVVVAVAFQMLCPGCVSHALPQAMRVRTVFGANDVAVIGLHAVFEHHEAQGSAAALAAFLHEYRIDFPVAIDKPAQGGGVPETMRAYAMQGTPTVLLIDRAGRLRLHRFGHVDDLYLGAAIQALVGEGARLAAEAPPAPTGGCDDGACKP